MPQYRGAVLVQFEEQAAPWSVTPEEQACPAHHGPQPGFQPVAARGWAGEGKERRSRHPKRAVQNLEGRPAAGGAAYPFRLPKAVIQARTELPGSRPFAGDSGGIPDPDAPGIIGVAGQRGSGVGDVPVLGVRNPAGVPGLVPGTVLHRYLITGLPGQCRVALPSLGKVPAEGGVAGGRQALFEPVRQQMDGKELPGTGFVRAGRGGGGPGCLRGSRVHGAAGTVKATGTDCAQGSPSSLKLACCRPACSRAASIP